MAGRPKRKFTDEQIQEIERYARINCNTETIADGMNIPVTTLKRHFGRKLTHWRAAGKLDMRNNLHNQAPTSPQIAIFIAKNELGMVDKQENTVRTEHVQQFTPEQLAQLKHLAGLADGINVCKLSNSKKLEKTG